MVLPGECTGSVFEEAVLHKWPVARPAGWGVQRAGSRDLRGVGSRLGFLTPEGKWRVLWESGTVLPLLTSAASGGGDQG